MSFLEKKFVRAAHPRRIIVQTVGWLWAGYFLWLHNWIWAVGALLLSMIVGIIVAPVGSPDNLAQTTIGKLALLHLHPANVSVQSIGLLLMIYGLWMHAEVMLMLAFSVIMLGHLWGWHRVNEAL